MKTTQLVNSICLIILLQLTTCQLYAQKIQEYTPIDISDINAEEYGQGTGIGFNIISGTGLMVRRTLKSQDQIGLSTSFFYTISVDTVATSFLIINPGISFTPEYNFHLANRYKEKVKRNHVKRKFRKHYLSVKAQVGLSTINTYTFALTWHRETFLLENKNHARGLDLGIRYTFANNTNRDGIVDLVASGPGIFFRFDWTWFKQRKK